MIHLFFVISGLLIGAMTGGPGDWLWGAVCGALFAEILKLRQRLFRLERPLESAAPPAEPTAPVEQLTEPVAVDDEIWKQERQDQEDTAPAAAALAEEYAAPADAALAENVAEQAVSDDPAPEPWSREPAVQAGPQAPSLIGRALAAIVEFITSGNPLVRVGSLVLFVGVAFLLNYLSERVTVAIEIRLAGIALGGVALLALGLRLRSRRPGFALPLQGAGAGVMFLTTFAAFRLYDVLPASAAFGLMLILVVLTAILALWQNARPLAVFGVVGGFLAPLLTSTGTGSHVELFGFYLVLNLLIAVVSWFRAWRVLNWVGFVFTFGVALLWGARYYQPEYFSGTEPFLIAHVLLYIALAVAFAIRQPPRLKGLVDGTLVFGTPLVAFSMQAKLLQDSEYGLAISALVLGLLYLILASVLWWRDREHFRLMLQCFAALGAGFVTLAIPLAFDARVTSALWTVEGAAVAWIGIQQSRLLARISGYALMVLGSLAYLLENQRGIDHWMFLNADFLGSTLIGVSFAWISHLLVFRPQFNRWLIQQGFWVYAALWLVVGGLVDVFNHDAEPWSRAIGELYLGVLVVLCRFHARSTGDSPLRWLTAVVVASLMGFLLMDPPALVPAVANANVLAALITAGTALFLGRALAHKPLDPEQSGAAYFNGSITRTLAVAMAVLAVVAWCVTGVADLSVNLTTPYWQHAHLLWCSAGLAMLFLLARPLSWPDLRFAAAGHLLILPWFFCNLALREAGTFQDWLWIAWIAVAALQLWMLRIDEKSGANSGYLTATHALGGLNLILVATYGVWIWGRGQWGHDSAVALSFLAWIPLIFLSVGRWAGRWINWPLAAQHDAYRGLWILPAVAWISGWVVWVNVSPPPDFVWTGFRPLINVLDLACLASVGLTGLWWRDHQQRLPSAALPGLIVFLWMNAAVLRSVHFLTDVPYRIHTLWDSFAAQASITLLWVACGLAVMIVGTRWVSRRLWATGAILMALAVIKLFAVDTAASDTLARIIAFFGVAGGLFVAGYFVPRPPSDEHSAPGLEDSA